ncbi:hypothetical protein [Staphylococcus agnetis]|uniref:hypothetical protein n=1 Tax=Staphylococcus agnetis TaxID=985762 RepID=UPI0021CE39C4|nr:hypothetical protein [Staphylococcus agnetis]UXU59033.1 hypothetical protein MUA97_09075 [Staphylococcus agnetis]UXU61359.1 hypothetical protein MUA43_09075 [Staphylococcus agnetis]
MEQITLTKQELKEIIAKEVAKTLYGDKSLFPGAIFNDVKIDEEEIAKINGSFSFTRCIKTPYRGHHYMPLALKKYRRGNEWFNGKVTYDQIHDHIRKLTLSMYGVTLNSDLSEVEYTQAAETYNALKEFYLHLYKKRLSKLSLEDFE